MNQQIQAQLEAVKRMETSSCNCIVYHPSGEEWTRIYKEWLSNKSSMDMVEQLFGKCKGEN